MNKISSTAAQNLASPLLAKSTGPDAELNTNSNNSSSTQTEENLHAEDLSRNEAEALAATHEDESLDRDPKAETYENKLTKFNQLAEKATIFELLMAGTGAAMTGLQGDWLSYFHETFGEYFRNKLGGVEEGKELPGYIKAAVKALSLIFPKLTKGLKGPLITKDIKERGEEVIGAVNIFTSGLTFLNLIRRAFSVFGNSSGKKDATEIYKINPARIITNYAAPIFNAALMWGTAAGKMKISQKLMKLPGENNNSQAGENMASGREDLNCGRNSAMLAVRQAIGAISPKLADILELPFGAMIGAISMKNGIDAYITGEGEEEADYKAIKNHEDIIIKPFYNFAKSLSGMFKLKLPKLTELN